MKKVLRSWRRSVVALLASVLLTVLLFLVWTNAFYFSQSNRQLQELHENALTLWVRTTESRLDTIHEHIRELLLTVYTNVVVTNENAVLSFQAERTCQSALEDKLQVSRDADCFYILDTKTEKLLFTAPTSLGAKRVLHLKRYAQEEAGGYVTSLNDAAWYVTEVAGEACFIKSISVGKYRVGSISRVSNFDFQKLASAMEAENSLLIATQSGRLFAGGSVDWSDELWDAGGGGLGSRRDRITVSVPFPAIDGELVWGVQSASLFDKGTRFVGSALLVSSMVCILLIVTLITVLREKVDNPVKHLLHAHKEIGGGNIQYRISQEPGSTEFEILFESFNSMADQIQNLRIESYDKTIREQEYQLQIVRAQLKPHFYLNAITTVSNMTYQNRVEDIRAFVQALGRYMRYMMNIQSDMVPVAEELSHIVNYMEMQQIRFPGSVDYTIACMEEVRGLRIPFLVLFTLVENAFKHALDLYKPLLLRIDCRPARQNGLSGYALSVEDNGGGFPQEVLDNFNGELPEGELPPKEHLGLTNIRYTLRYSYHRQASLRLLNAETGAKAVIWIPSGEGAKEEK